jgi:CubicO group peptidase (beta-lactamase class C family)
MCERLHRNRRIARADQQQEACVMVISAVLALVIQGTPSVPACGAGIDNWPTKKWETGTPAALGFNGDSLQAIVERARAIPGVTSLMIVRHGQIALEEYFHGGGRGDPMPVASVTKSVTSMLVGIAMGQGLIDSLDQPLIQLVPQVAPPAGRPSGTITIRQLLTMTSGLSETWYQEKPLQLRIMSPPGSSFRYSNEAVQFLIRAIAETSRESMLKYSRANLWKPLNIDVDESRWPKFEVNGSGDGAAGLILTTRELAKLGLLALREGCWEGRQVVPAAYLQEAMRKQVAAGGPEPNGRAYGFLFWITPAGIPFMAGQGGQYVVIDAANDIVAITTARGDAPEPDYEGQFRLVSGDVRGAILAPAGPAP